MKVSRVLLIMALVLSLPAPIGAGTVCLSHRDARKLWPRIHLWWVYDKQTGDKCWTNVRGKPPRGIKVDPIKDIHAEAELKKAAPPVKIVKPDEFNEIDAMADQDTFFNAKPLPYWQYVRHVDLGLYRTWYDRAGNAFR